MKTIKQLALEFANNLDNQLNTCPLGCINPGLYYGFLAGAFFIKEELEIMGYDYQELLIGGEFIPRSEK